MDLVQFDEAVFIRIKQEVTVLASKIGFEGELHFIPIAPLRASINTIDASAFEAPVIMFLVYSI